MGQISEDVRCLVERLLYEMCRNRFWEEERTETYLGCSKNKGVRKVAGRGGVERTVAGGSGKTESTESRLYWMCTRKPVGGLRRASCDLTHCEGSCERQEGLS